MVAQSTHSKTNSPSNLADYTRLAIAFFAGFLVLAVYQQAALAMKGVLDSPVNKSLLILIVHHLGFASLAALILAFLYKGLERKKAGLGFKFSAIIFALLLLLESLLTIYYLTNYEILGAGFLELYSAKSSSGLVLKNLGIILPLLGLCFYLVYRFTAPIYRIIGRMYPFTIILFSLFLATLGSDRKPINENKTQYLTTSILRDVFETNTYSGEATYPLLRPYDPNNELNPYFELGEEKPDIVFVVLDGIGSDFVGRNSRFRGFAPFLDSLIDKSLYWDNFLSNTAESEASLASILGSLPFGRKGFTQTDKVNRQTLLGILKKNGYRTAFYYGGNSALGQLDKFFFEERTDYLLDVKGFGDQFTKQEEDAAGISLGYHDKELYRKWADLTVAFDSPKLEVFLNLSSKWPFAIPEAERYEDSVDAIIARAEMPERDRRVVERHKEIFASIRYADDALKILFDGLRRQKRYANTIFVLTASHNLTELPHSSELDRYKVPFMIYSPLLRHGGTISSMVSHADIVPALAGLLQDRYKLKMPDQVAWLGDGLITEGPVSDRAIGLYRHSHNTEDFIKGRHFLSDGNLFRIGSQLELQEVDDEEREAEVAAAHKWFKAVNKYVTEENKLIPPSQALFAQLGYEPSKEEMVWINSVFNGKDFDNAYETARDLALDGRYDRALLLGGYILSEVPGHADTEILMGRVYGWQGRYELAAEILEGTIQKYPVYTDAYAALLDVYYWSGQDYKALRIRELIGRNQLKSEELKAKIERALKKMDVQGVGATTGQEITQN